MKRRASSGTLPAALAARLAELEADKEARPDGWTKQKQAEHEALLQKKHEMRTVLGSSRR